MRHQWDSQHFREGARAAGRPEDVIDAAIAAAQRIKWKDRDLPVILTLGHLAHLIDVSLPALMEIVNREAEAYRIFRVKKRALPGETAATRRYRTICVPHPTLMRVQRWIAQNILNVVIPHPASFAFAPGRDLVQAARLHSECKWLVKLDVVNFFESITERQVYGVFRSLGYGALIAFELARLCTRTLRHQSRGKIGDNGLLPHLRLPPGHLPQGAPSSPMLANLAVQRLDKRLSKFASDIGWIYTRYADDFAFSTPQKASRREAMKVVARAMRELKSAGLTYNRSKTQIVPPGSRKVFLGVLVDRGEPKLTKEFRANIETHLYALNHEKIGSQAHLQRRGFDSVIGMRKHIAGLISFAHQVDKNYAAKLYKDFNSVDWSR